MPTPLRIRELLMTAPMPTERTEPDPPQELRPPLKWAGGKRWLVPHIRPLWEAAGMPRLVEPFCGGLAIPLALRPARALLNDINPHLIHFYRWLQRGLEIRIPMENDPELYYAHRARFNHLIRSGQEESLEAVSLFYYLNRTGYNGLCRFNKRGEFNVPMGRYKRIRYRRDFTAYRPVLASWTFRWGDFEKLRLEPTDFLYADPPYDVPFRQYTKDGFAWEDQIRLAEWLARHPGPVVASNQATARILALYRGLGFQVQILDGPRRIACTGDRSPAQEILALRNIPGEGTSPTRPSGGAG